MRVGGEEASKGERKGAERLLQGSGWKFSRLRGIPARLSTIELAPSCQVISYRCGSETHKLEGSSFSWELSLMRHGALVLGGASVHSFLGVRTRRYILRNGLLFFFLPL